MYAHLYDRHFGKQRSFCVKNNKSGPYYIYKIVYLSSRYRYRINAHYINSET